MLHMLDQRALAARAAADRCAHEARGARARQRARPSHRGKARQPGRVLHHGVGWSPRLPRRSHPAPPRPCRRWRGPRRRRSRCGRARHGWTAARSRRARRGDRSYAVAVDVAGATSCVGSADDLLTDSQALDAISFVGAPRLARCSRSAARTASHARRGSTAPRSLGEPQRRVAPGQSIAFYDLTDTELLGGATAA